MSLSERLQDDLKAAMKAGNVVARQTLRLSIAAIKNRRIEKGEDLSDKDVLAILAKEVKKRQDSAEQYGAAGRDDLKTTELAEIEVLQGYLPKQLGEEETNTVVRETIERLGLTSKKEMGQVMKAVMADHKGQIDGKLVQRIAGELLS